jgi:hypothetical protein
MDFALDNFNTGGLVLDDRDTIFLAIGTAIGSLQTPLLKRVTSETPRTGTAILTSPSGIAAIAVGLACIGAGIGARTGVIDFNKDIATLMMGYGISCVISLAINYATSSAFSSTAGFSSTKSFAI